MKFYINEKLRTNFNIVDTVNELLKDVNKLDGYYDVDYIKSIRPTVDYVREFIDYYFDDINYEVSNEVKDYIVNRLYAVKGGPNEVSNVMTELLTVVLPDGKLRDFTVTCNYEFPNLSILQFESVEVTDINVFLKRLKDALFVLIFYDKLNIIIKHLIQVITGDLIDYSKSFIKPYVTMDLICNESLPWKQ